MPGFLIGMGVMFTGVALDAMLETYERVSRRQRLRMQAPAPGHQATLPGPRLAPSLSAWPETVVVK